MTMRTWVEGLAAAMIWLAATGTVRAAEPETVMITLHAKAGAETQLAQVIARHWEAVQRLGMTTDGPHVTLRGTEEGTQTFFVEILTWRDASVPDAAPKEILAIWADMNRLVEKRNGKAGLTITEMSLLAK